MDQENMLPDSPTVYVAEAVALSVIPLLKALALTVVVLVIDMELEYAVDVDVGWEPSTVYRTVAPSVLHVIVTD